MVWPLGQYPGSPSPNTLSSYAGSWETPVLILITCHWVQAGQEGQAPLGPGVGSRRPRSHPHPTPSPAPQLLVCPGGPPRPQCQLHLGRVLPSATAGPPPTAPSRPQLSTHHSGTHAEPNSWVPGSGAAGTPAEFPGGPARVSQGGRDRSRGATPPRPRDDSAPPRCRRSQVDAPPGAAQSGTQVTLIWLCPRAQPILGQEGIGRQVSGVGVEQTAEKPPRPPTRASYPPRRAPACRSRVCSARARAPGSPARGRGAGPAELAGRRRLKPPPLGRPPLSAAAALRSGPTRATLRGAAGGRSRRCPHPSGRPGRALGLAGRPGRALRSPASGALGGSPLSPRRVVWVPAGATGKQIEAQTDVEAPVGGDAGERAARGRDPDPPGSAAVQDLGC
ncbi:basic proline-rich protein-like [Cynocephalus volans]|uniref:basic proline-rich protein-like n=1 Tax=Cynocephalus volans TaxID=110931 RepID=UPI002FC6C836